MFNREDLQLNEDRYYRDTPSLKHNLSFAGCGFLGLYHVGVCKCIRHFAPHLYQNKPISGSSAGAIAAACLICDVNIIECVQYMCELISNCRKYFLGPFDPRFQLNEHLREGLSRILPSDAHVLCSGRLSVSLTSYPSLKNVVVNNFKSKDELISVIISSTFIPLFSGFVPATYRGQLVLDGGFSDNLLCIDRMTITVSPFIGDADICPMNASWDSGYLTSAPPHVEEVLGTVYFMNNAVRLNWANVTRLIHVVWPMSPEGLKNLASQGYADALRYLTTRGFIACRLHKTPRAFSNVVRGRRHSHNAVVHRLHRNASTSSLRLTFSSQSKMNNLSHNSLSPPLWNSHPNSPTCNNENRHLVGSGVGLNVAKCLACQEELRLAHTSSLPAFLRSIIMGDIKNQRPMSRSFYWSLFRQGCNMVQRAIRKGSSQLSLLTHQLICFPVFAQLDFLIHVISKSLEFHASPNFCRTSLCNLLSVLQTVRCRVATWDVNSAVQSANNSCHLRKCTSVDDLNKFTTTHDVRHRPLGEYHPSTDMTHRIRTMVTLHTNNVSDLFLPIRRIALPTAEECGLELFGARFPDLRSRHFSLFDLTELFQPMNSNRWPYHSASETTSLLHVKREDEQQIPMTPSLSNLMTRASDPDVTVLRAPDQDKFFLPC